MLEAERALEIGENECKNTLIRIDGDGVEADSIWWLQRQYHILIKIKSWHRAIRTSRPQGSWHYQVLVFSLNDAKLFELCNRPLPNALWDLDLVLAALHVHDLRDGGLETQN